MEDKTPKEQNEVFECIKEILTKKEYGYTFDIDPFIIKPTSQLHQDLGLDSFDIYSLIFLIEEKLAINIPDKKIWEFKTIKDIMIFAAKQI